MRRVVLRQEAIDDLNDIWDYTFRKWSEKQADKYYYSLKQACNRLGVNPKLGKEFPNIYENLRGLRSGKHIIFYEQIRNDRIEIIRVLYERMDFENRLAE